jgi:hypothetical protein
MMDRKRLEMKTAEEAAKLTAGNRYRLGHAHASEATSKPLDRSEIHRLAEALDKRGKLDAGDIARAARYASPSLDEVTAWNW